jgi:hypothetical protein
VSDSLIDAVSVAPGNIEAMNEAQRGVVGFLCVFDFVFPRPGAC